MLGGAWSFATYSLLGTASCFTALPTEAPVKVVNHKAWFSILGGGPLLSLTNQRQQKVCIKSTLVCNKSLLPGSSMVTMQGAGTERTCDPSASTNHHTEAEA